MLNLFLQKGREVLDAQPFSCMMGAELTDLSDGKAELSLKIRESFKQSYGFVHGGVISYMADNCLTFAGATQLGNCVTSEFKINYLVPSVGDRIVARANVISVSLRQAVCECKVYTESGRNLQLVAVAQGTIVKVENELLRHGNAPGRSG
jgi:acyl-CoA thioesterase